MNCFLVFVNGLIFYICDMESFNEKIKRLRKSKGLKQDDICQMIGITQPSFASIENGKTKSVSIDLGKKIANALNVSFNELFDIEYSGYQKCKEENENLIKENIALKEEILKDKRTIIDFLSLNDLLLPLAAKIYNEKKPKNETVDLNNIEEVLADLYKLPYDRSDKQSMIKYILENQDVLKSSFKE